MLGPFTPRTTPFASEVNARLRSAHQEWAERSWPASRPFFHGNREQKTRALLAELGIPPESAAVSLKAAKEALIRCMPETESSAASVDELVQTAQIPTRTTVQKALRELLATGKIQRIVGEGKGSPFRYFARGGK